MYNIQVLASEYKKEWFHLYNEKYKVNILDSADEINPTIPIICSGDLLSSDVRRWLTCGQPAVYVARGYLGNHLYKHRKFFRYSVNGWANIELLPIPYSRWSILGLEKHPWKVKEIKNVLIAPSKMTSKIWTPDLSHNWAEYMSTKFPGANVKIRYKGKSTAGSRYSTLWNDFDWADLVVSQSSAITVEAFWYGKKVISTEPCPTWAASRNTIDDWQNPAEPELRDLWHEHIAWCQYTVDEIQSGLVLDLLQKYFGNIVKYKHPFKYLLH